MYKRKRKSKQQEERREDVAQPTPLQTPPSDEILPTTGAAVDDEEEEQVPQNAPLPVISKRCRLVTAFTDKEEDAIIEFLQNHPEIYNKEHERYADKYHKEALWVEIATELKLDANDVKRWYTSKRTTFGKVSKNKSGQAPASFTPRQKWVYDRMSFMRGHIRRKGENITAGLEASSSRVHNDSTCSSTDVESLDASGRSPVNLGPISTDHKLLEHFETMKTMVSKFVEKPADERTLFFYFVASEASKLSEEQYHTLKGQVFNALQNITASNLKPATPSKAPPLALPPTPRQAAPLPRRTATVTSDTQAMGILPPQGPTRQAAASASSSNLLHYTLSQVGFGQDESSCHNLSGFLSLSDITGVTDVNTPQVFIASPATPSTSQQPLQQQQPPQ